MPAARTNRVRMSDVAREAGVALVTVSRAINTPDKVAEETLTAVRSAVARLGYLPNLTAGSLASSRSRIVAAIVPTISNPVFAETVEALTLTLAEGGYQLLLGQNAYRASDEEALVEAFLGRRVDGLVLTGCGQSRSLRDRLRQAGVPMVQTWDLPESGATPRAVLDMAVGFSNVAAGRAAARHLIERGHRRLGFLGADEERSRQRLEGFRAEVEKAGLAAVATDLMRPPVQIDQAASQLAQLRARRDPPTALLCSNDLLAAGVLFECRRLGLAVPRQLAVVGFGDLPIARAASPQLSTVRVRRAEMGERAGRMLLARLAGGDPGARHVDLGFELVARETT